MVVTYMHVIDWLFCGPLEHLVFMMIVKLVTPHTRSEVYPSGWGLAYLSLFHWLPGQGNKCIESSHDLAIIVWWYACIFSNFRCAKLSNNEPLARCAKLIFRITLRKIWSYLYIRPLLWQKPGTNRGRCVFEF